jgi:hypothetical protein
MTEIVYFHMSPDMHFFSVFPKGADTARVAVGWGA